MSLSIFFVFFSNGASNTSIALSSIFATATADRREEKQSEGDGSHDYRGQKPDTGFNDYYALHALYLVPI